MAVMRAETREAMSTRVPSMVALPPGGARGGQGLRAEPEIQRGGEADDQDDEEDEHAFHACPISNARATRETAPRRARLSDR
jgi:hypothetical protein